MDDLFDPEDLADLDNACLLDNWAIVKNSETMYRRSKELIEYELIRRMQESGAKEIYHPKIACKLEPRTTYDPGKLSALKELIEPTLLVDGYTPAHQETIEVPEQWDMRVVLAWDRKYGDLVRQAVESAVIRGQPRLICKIKKGGEHDASDTG